MSKRSFVWLLALAAGCSHHKPPAEPAVNTQPPGATEPVAREDGGCPIKNVPGMSVSTEDTSDGVAIVFTTTGDVADLQQRVHQLAAMHEQRGETGPTSVPVEESRKPPVKEGPSGVGANGRASKDGGPITGAGAEAEQQGELVKPVPGAHAMPTTMSRATVEDVPNGARLIITPVDPRQVETVRDRAKLDAQAMQGGVCPTPEQPVATGGESSTPG
jgi:hypothetical protein